MFAYRWTYRVKFGRMAEVIEVVEEIAAKVWKPKNVVCRIYNTSFGPGQTFAFEMEAESEEQYAGYWKRYEAEDSKSRAVKALTARFNSLVDSYVASERWILRK